MSWEQVTFGGRRLWREANSVGSDGPLAYEHHIDPETRKLRFEAVFETSFAHAYYTDPPMIRRFHETIGHPDDIVIGWPDAQPTE